MVDSVVTFSCDRGYRLQGSARRRCTTQGTWDGVNAKCVGQSYTHSELDKLTHVLETDSQKCLLVLIYRNLWQCGNMTVLVYVSNVVFVFITSHLSL